MKEKEEEENKRGTTQSLSVTVVGSIVLQQYIGSYMGERERVKKNSERKTQFFFFFIVCVCIKNGKGPVGGMLGLGQRDGVAYKRITPNIRQNKRTFFVFTSFSLCFSCFACCFCCCFSCTTSFWHFATSLSLSLSYYYHSSRKGCDL